jgi:hypothetical protein
VCLRRRGAWAKLKAGTQPPCFTTMAALNADMHGVGTQTYHLASAKQDEVSWCCKMVNEVACETFSKWGKRKCEEIAA